MLRNAATLKPNASRNAFGIIVIRRMLGARWYLMPRYPSLRMSVS
jgi:hypothetical protein